MVQKETTDVTKRRSGRSGLFAWSLRLLAPRIYCATSFPLWLNPERERMKRLERKQAGAEMAELTKECEESAAQAVTTSGQLYVQKECVGEERAEKGSEGLLEAGDVLAAPCDRSAPLQYHECQSFPAQTSLLGLVSGGLTRGLSTHSAHSAHSGHSGHSGQ